MRILTLLSGPEAVPFATQLTEGIRSFNAEIDFRLRFLHVEIEEVRVAGSQSAEALPATDGLPPVQVLPDCGSKSARTAVAAARLALILAKERPSVLVMVGPGALAEAAAAAAEATEVKIACFGMDEAPQGALDLGSDAATALDRLTGVAREIG